MASAFYSYLLYLVKGVTKKNLALGAQEKNKTFFVIFHGQRKDFGPATPLQNAGFASATLDCKETKSHVGNMVGNSKANI